MAADTSTMTLAKMRGWAEKAKDKMARFRKHAEEQIGHGIQGAEVSGTAFGMGYLNARYGKDGELKVLGLPVDLAAAIGMHGVAFAGGLGKYKEHGHNVGDGALASFAYRFGSQLGTNALKNANAPKTEVKGIPSSVHHEFSAGEANGVPVGGRAWTVQEQG
jgi:hypothetical protein